MAELWLKNSVTIAICILIGLFLQWLIFKLLKIGNKRKSTVLKEQTLKRLKTPSIFLLPILFIYGSLSLLELNAFWRKLIEVFKI